MAHVATTTFEEFLTLPEPKEGAFYELRGGEVVLMTRPKMRHARLQQRLERLLIPLADAVGFLSIEVAFRALPEGELRVADIAWLSARRAAEVEDEGFIPGAPNLVIEVASDSNTSPELKEKQILCLANGCEEFWVVYPKLNLVEVTTRNGSRDYGRGEAIPLPLFGDASLEVSAIFAGA